MDKAICGNMRCDNSRSGVYSNSFDKLLSIFKNLGVATMELTRRRLMLYSPANSVTGWYPKSYELIDIEGLMVSKASTRSAQVVGSYVRNDYLLFTQEPFFEGDEVEDVNHSFYEVKAVRPFSASDDFSHYEVDLASLPMHHLSYSSTTPTVEDARSLTKAYWDGHITSSNLQGNNFLVCYSDPDYPLTQVFATKHIDIIFSIDQGTSESRLGVRSMERVPTHVVTLDTELQWLGEAELRKVVEDHPLGSLRTLNMVTKHDSWLGSSRLFDTEFMLGYTRTSARGMA